MFQIYPEITGAPKVAMRFVPTRFLHRVHHLIDLATVHGESGVRTVHAQAQGRIVLLALHFVETVSSHDAARSFKWRIDPRLVWTEVHERTQAKTDALT